MAVTGVNNYTNTYAATGGTKASSGLSETAQNYLNELKQKYSDINITVKDFGNDKQLKGYMLGISGYNNVAISSAIIEKMASDPATVAKYEKIIADVPKSAEEAKKGCEAQGVELVAHSVIIDKDGKVSYCGVGRKTTENPGTAYKEKIQKQSEEKRAKKKEEEKLKEKKRTEKKEEEKRVAKAESAEKLAEMLKANRQAELENADMVNIPEEGKGAQVDVGI